MFITVTNVIVALFVGRVLLVVLVSEYSSSTDLERVLISALCSDGYGPDRRRGEPVVCADQPRGDVLGVRRGLCVCSGHALRCESVSSVRPERRRPGVLFQSMTQVCVMSPYCVRMANIMGPAARCVVRFGDYKDRVRLGAQEDVCEGRLRRRRDCPLSPARPFLPARQPSPS